MSDWWAPEEDNTAWGDTPAPNFDLSFLGNAAANFADQSGGGSTWGDFEQPAADPVGFWDFPTEPQQQNWQPSFFDAIGQGAQNIYNQLPAPQDGFSSWDSGSDYQQPANIYDQFDQQNQYNPAQDIGANFNFIDNLVSPYQEQSQGNNIYDQLDFYQAPSEEQDAWNASQGIIRNFFNQIPDPRQRALNEMQARISGAVNDPFGSIDKGAEIVSQGLGTVFSKPGEAVDWAARSDIPVLNTWGQALQTGYEQIAEPLLNFTPAMVGYFSDEIGHLNGDKRDNNPMMFQQWQDPQEIFNTTYDQLKAQGLSDEDAWYRANRDAAKQMNPLNAFERRGVQQFGTLPATVQLGVSLADPIGNKVGNALFEPVIKAPIKAAGKVADATGLSKAGDFITRKLEAPEQQLAGTGKIIDTQIIPEAERLSTTGDNPPTFREALDMIVNQQDSPYYYERLGIGDPKKAHLTEAAIQETRNLLDEGRASELGDLQNIQRENLQSSKVYATDEAQAAQFDQMGQPQKENLPPEQKLASDLNRKYNLPVDEATDIARRVTDNPAFVETLKDTPYNGMVDFIQKHLDNTKAISDFDRDFATSPRIDPSAPVKINERPEYYNAIKPLKGEFDAAAYRDTVNQALSARFGKSKLDTTPLQTGKPPKLVEQRQMAKLGVAGSVLRGMGLPVNWIASTALNSFSRAVRDTAGNVAKVQLEGYNTAKLLSKNTEFDRIFGKERPTGIGKEAHGQSAEIGQTKNKLVRGAQFVANWQNEIPSFIMNKATKGKVKNFNQLADEIAQPMIERGIVKQEAVQGYNDTINRYVKQGANTKVAQAFRELTGRNLTEGDLKAILRGDMPPATLTTQAAEGYSPTAYNGKVFDLREQLANANSPFANAVAPLFDETALQSALDAYNAEKKQAYLGGLKSTKDAKKLGKEATAPFVPDTLADLNPNHPVIKQIEKTVNDVVSVVYDNTVKGEEAALRSAKADPQIEQLVNNFVAAKATEHLQRTLDLKGKARDNAGKTTDLYDKLAEQRQQAETQAKQRAEQQQRQRDLTDPAFKGFYKNYKIKYPNATPEQGLARFKQLQVEKASKAIGENMLEAGDVVKMPVSSIKFDPDRFQYKTLQTSGKGEVGSLQGVQKFDKTKAGVIQVWKDPKDGNTYVINGHNRLALAERLGEKNINAMVIDAKTPEEARAIGAITNISEGRGNAIDAAKFIRDSKLSPDQLRAQGVPLKERVAQDGIALANLAPEIFSKVAKYEMPLERGIEIGRKLPDPAQQRRLMKLLDKYEQKGKPLTQGVINELADQVKATNASAETGQQLGLFGVEQFEKTYDLERAGLADYVRTKLSSDKKLFSAAAKGAESLKQVGDIDAARAAGISEEAARLQQLFDAYKNTPGDVSDILNNYSRQIADNPRQANVLKQQAYAELQEKLPQQIKTRAEASDTAPQGQGNLFDDSQYKSPELVDAGAPEQLKPDTATQNQNKIDNNQPKQENQPVQLSPDRLQFYSDNIYNAPNVETPQTLKQLAAKYSKADASQRRTYVQNMLDTDRHIREVTGNRYKLDPQTLEPINIESGKYLAEELGQSKPQPINPDYKPPLEYKGDLQELINDIKNQYFDENGDSLADKSFLDMNPAERELIMSEISYAVLGVDPTNVQRVQTEMNAHRATLTSTLDAIKSDMQDRYNAKKEGVKQGINREQQIKDALTTLQQEAAATQARARVAGIKRGQEATKKIFFDYSNKNLVDQALGSILPFNFWARQNFAYLARHFASHPMHFAAILNFYNNLEEENRKNGVPGYARGNIYLWQNPDGSKVLWNFSSALPFNPLNDAESSMTVIDALSGDNTATANKNPLAMLFGSEKSGGGRDKGVLPTFLRPNPLIDLATKTGLVSNFYKAMGWTTDNFGSAGKPTDQTLGLIPSRGITQTLGAATGLTQQLRAMGVPITDLDLEAPINELLFGKNAGKPLSKVQQELTAMAQNKEISQEEALKTLAALKQGNWNATALKALDKVDGESAAQKLANFLGFSTVVTNNPRQQLNDKISQGYQEVKGNKDATKKFFNDNPGATVAFSGSKTPEQINEGIANTQKIAQQQQQYQQKKQADQELYNQVSGILKDKNLTQQQKEVALAKLQGANPDYFAKHPVTVYPSKQQTTTTRTATTTKQPYTPYTKPSSTTSKGYSPASRAIYTPAKKPYTPAPKKSYQPAAKGKASAPKQNQNIYTKLGLDFTRKPYTPQTRPSYTKTLPKPKAPARTAYTKPTPNSPNQFRKPLAVSYNKRYTSGGQDVMSRLKSTALGRNMTLPPPVFTVKKKKK